MMVLGKLLSGGLCLVLAGSALAGFEQVVRPPEDDYDAKPWQEQEVQLPEAPRPENLQAVYVSAATSNKFFVDGATLSVGSDGVVRYTLVVLTPEGGRNVSFEGMRCATKERRIYASGRADGSWSKSRAAQWSRIQDAASNRQYAALYLEYFCNGGAIVRNADEARSLLKRGGISGSTMW
ncbi:MAG: CNP1-like family protein [Bacteroidota bacterium]